MAKEEKKPRVITKPDEPPKADPPAPPAPPEEPKKDESPLTDPTTPPPAIPKAFTSSTTLKAPSAMGVRFINGLVLISTNLKTIRLPVSKGKTIIVSVTIQ